jgi:hypothetical protein
LVQQMDWMWAHQWVQHLVLLWALQLAHWWGRQMGLLWVLQREQLLAQNSGLH